MFFWFLNSIVYTPYCNSNTSFQEATHLTSQYSIKVSNIRTKCTEQIDTHWHVN